MREPCASPNFTNLQNIRSTENRTNIFTNGFENFVPTLFLCALNHLISKRLLHLAERSREAGKLLNIRA